VLADLLQRNSAAIKERWLKRTLASYPQDSTGFFLQTKDRFANPVGQTLATETGALVDCLMDGADAAELCLHLEEIVKIRAVQDFTPSEAVSFVFLLKETIREELRGDLSEPRLLAELVAFEDRIDQMALFAFDIFVKWREKVYSLRVREIKAGYVQPE
jgi:hypothetical protein